MMRPKGNLWVILLAGGDGARLMGEIVAGRRVDRPKQFCRFGGKNSLLGSTLERALQITDASRVIAVVSAHHDIWWGGDLGIIPKENVLVQPLNRGTAVAILHAVIHILGRDEDATVAIFPCDHGVEDEPILLNTLRAAVQHVRDQVGRLLLIGVTADRAETQYGWIVPDGALGHRVRAVRAFVEKPARELATALMRQGAVWNSFIVAAAAVQLYRLHRRILPMMVAMYPAETVGGSGWGRSLDAFYRAVPPADFSRHVLQHGTELLSVMRLPPCGWTDLGTAARVESWMESCQRNESLMEPRLARHDERLGRHHEEQEQVQ